VARSVAIETGRAGGSADRARLDGCRHRAFEPEETGTRLGDDAAAAGDDRHVASVAATRQRRVIAP
jgi:hypothetical protein